VSELAGGKLRLDRPAPHVARLTIDNPAKRNALDHDILDAITASVRGLDDARCLLLTAVAPATTSAGCRAISSSTRPSRSSRIRSAPRSRRSRRSRIPPLPRSTATRSAAGSSWR
jgi:hypothetical protein